MLTNVDEANVIDRKALFIDKMKVTVNITRLIH